MQKYRLFQLFVIMQSILSNQHTLPRFSFQHSFYQLFNFFYKGFLVFYQCSWIFYQVFWHFYQLFIFIIDHFLGAFFGFLRTFLQKLQISIPPNDGLEIARVVITDKVNHGILFQHLSLNSSAVIIH